MPEDEEVVAVLDSSDDDNSTGALENENTEEQEASSSDDKGTAEEPTATPTVEDLQEQVAEYEGKLNRANEAYNSLRSQYDTTSQKLRPYEQAEAARLKEVQENQDAWLDAVSDPVKGAALIKSLVDREIQGREQTASQLVSQREAEKAFADAQGYAKKAGMTDAQFGALVQEYTVNGVTMPGLPPELALRTFQRLIDSNPERMKQAAALSREAAHKDAQEKANKTLKNKSPDGGTAPAIGTSDDPQSAYKNAVMQANKGGIDDWLPSSDKAA